MVLLTDGESVRIDGKTFALSQGMVRTKPRRLGPLWLRTVWVAAPILFGVAFLVFPTVRLGTALFVGLYLIAMNVDTTGDKMYAKIMPITCKGLDRAIREVKETLLVPSLRGRVLDFGAGDGQYLRYIAQAYTKGQVTSVVSLEPNRELHRVIQHRAIDAGIKDEDFTIFGGDASELLRDRGRDSFDTIICGNVLCEVPNPKACCSVLYQLLAHNGRLFFVEHVREPWGSWARRIQDTFNPLYRMAAGRCNVNRESLRSIEAQPWKVYAWELQIPQAKPLLGRMHTGIAEKK